MGTKEGRLRKGSYSTASFKQVQNSFNGLVLKITLAMMVIMMTLNCCRSRCGFNLCLFDFWLIFGIS
jgi:hypothetical protein